MKAVYNSVIIYDQINLQLIPIIICYPEYHLKAPNDLICGMICRGNWFGAAEKDERFTVKADIYTQGHIISWEKKMKHCLSDSKLLDYGYM